VRSGGGHVGFYVGEDDRTVSGKPCYHVLGGNQSDAVTIARIDKDRMRACRQFFRNGKPDNVRPVILAARGKISEDEA